MEKMRKQFIVAIMALLFLAVLMVTAVMSVPAKEHSDFRFTGNVTQLWDEPYAGANWTNAFSVRDLNGDDKADVLVLTSSYNEATGTETATVIAKRGSDGEHLWEEPVTGTAGTNISAFGAGDLDGDKNEDVLVLISTSETETVIAKRGSDGKHIWTELVSGTVPTLIVSAGDLGEDETGDVLVMMTTSELDMTTFTTNTAARLIAKRGCDGEPLWEEHVNGTGWIPPSALLVGDLDGDGKDDVLVQMSTTELDMASDTLTTTATVIAKRGCNGEQLWNDSVSGTVRAYISASRAGDLDGDEMDDVLVQMSTTELDMASGNITMRATVIAKRGCNGEPLWEEPVDGFGWALPAGDLDGDGMDDVLVQISSTERDTASGTSTTTATVIAKRGYDGEQLWEEPVTGTELFLFALPAGDLDGDDQADVLVQMWRYNETTRNKTATVIAKRGHNGEHLWEESVTGMDLSALPAGDLNGDKKRDVVVHIHEYDEATDTTKDTVIAKRGYDGKHIWTTESNGPIWVGSAWADLNGDEIADVLLGSRDQVYALGYREE